MLDYPSSNRFACHDDVQIVLGPRPGTSLVAIVKYLRQVNRLKVKEVQSKMLVILLMLSWIPYMSYAPWFYSSSVTEKLDCDT